MAELARKTGNFPLFSIDTPSKLTVFGGTTLSTNIDDIVDTDEFKDGWGYLNGTVAPPEQDFNALGYSLSYVASYYLQKGIPEWDGTDGVIGGQEYIAGKSYVGHGGDIYVALLNSGGSVEARVPTNVTYWKKVSSVGLDINGQTDKTTPIDSDNFIIQEIGGLFKKLNWANLKATVVASLGVMINTVTAKTTPVDADVFIIGDSASSFASKKSTLANLKTVLLAYFDTFYSRTTAIFGIGQTNVDVTGSRLAGTSYVNSTGKTIFVQIEATSGGGGAQLTPQSSGGLTLPSSGGSSVAKASVWFHVESSASYVVAVNLGSITKWVEFR